MDEFLILLQAKLDEAKSKGNVNADIKELQNQLDKLKVQVELDPKAAQKLANDIGKLINQKIVISNIGIDTKSGVKAGQEYGKQVSQGISQGISSASKSTEKVLRDFSELNAAKRKFVDGHDLISKDDIADAERLYDTVRKAFSEFGQVTVSKGSMNDGSLENMRVKIEQVNGEMKITRDFMLYFNESKNGFRLVDDDTIRTTEKMVQHLNEEKNIVNATNEEANAIKAKLADQEKYYKNIKNEVNNLYNLKTKLLSADELQTAELEKQIKQTKERISYNNKQIDKKDLRDSSLDRQINDLEVAKQKQLDLASAKSQDTVNTKELAQAEREATAALKERQAIEAQVNKIQLSIETGETESKINALISKTNQWTDTEGKARINTQSLTDALSALDHASNEYIKTPTEENQKELIEINEKLGIEYKKVASEVRSMNAEFAKDSAVDSLRQQYQNFYSENGKAHKLFGDQLKSAMVELSSGSEVPRQKVEQLKKELIDTKNVCKELGLTGQTWFQNLGDKIKQLSTYLSGAMIISKATSTVRDEISELKELDSILTEITKTADLTEQQLKELGNSSFESASEYGKTASDYLTGVQEMYRAGFKNAEAMAKLSLLAQSAGDLAPDSSNDYLMATNAAYDYKGSVEELNKVLDSQNFITNNAAVSMQDMADATSEAASISAQYGVGIEELSSLIAVAVSKTRESGSEVGNALKSIFVTLQDTTSKPVVEAFDAVGISMTKIVDGSERLKTPIELLKELSAAFNELPEGDTKRANILTDIGKKYHANTLSAILSDWESYESMLDLYSQGIGSAAKEAEKSANNIQGSFNILKNTWIDTIQNIINSDAVNKTTKSLNSMLTVINKITDKLGSLGTIGTIGGAIAGAKGQG